MRTARPTRAALTSPALRSFHSVVLDSPDSSSACLYVSHSRLSLPASASSFVGGGFYLYSVSTSRYASVTDNEKETWHTPGLQGGSDAIKG